MQEPLNSLKKRFLIDLSKSEPSFPTENLTFLLDADKAGLGPIDKWVDQGPQKIEFKFSGKNKPVVKINKKTGNKSVTFSPPGFLQSKPVLPTFLPDDNFAIFIVFTVFREKEDRNYNDPFNWGDCKENRFLVHVNYSRAITFQMGIPKDGLNPIEGANFSNQLNLMVIRKKQDDFIIEFNGVVVAYTDKKQTDISREEPMPFRIGNSFCDNGFLGEIAEFAIFKNIQDPSQSNQITKFLAKKYKIKL